jgi:hypothetical protein
VPFFRSPVPRFEIVTGCLDVCTVLCFDIYAALHVLSCSFGRVVCSFVHHLLIVCNLSLSALFLASWRLMFSERCSTRVTEAQAHFYLTSRFCIVFFPAVQNGIEDSFSFIGTLGFACLQSPHLSDSFH